MDEVTKVATNVAAALKVMHETYEATHKLFVELASLAPDHGLTQLNPHFLRWRSDTDWNSWALASLVHLFHHDPESGQAADVLVVLEVNLWGWDRTELATPQLLLSAMRFPGVDVSTLRAGQAEHWRYYNPVHDHSGEFERSAPEGRAGLALLRSRPRTTRLREQYQGLAEVVTHATDLIQISSKEALAKVLDRLPELEAALTPGD